MEKCVKVYPHEQTKVARYGGHYLGWDDDDDFDLYRPYGGFGGYGVYSGVHQDGGCHWTNKGGHYTWDSEQNKYVWKSDAELKREKDIDDMNTEIFDLCYGGMSDKEILEDLLYFFPDYDSSFIQGLIDDVRKSYKFYS